MQRAALKPTVDEESCAGCGICAENCPSSAIRVDDVAKIDTSRCMACGNCVRVCPQDAIRLASTRSSEARSSSRKLQSLKERAEKLSGRLSEIERELQKLMEASTG